MTRLALGTAQFGLHYGVANEAGQIQPEEARKIIHALRAEGHAAVDTAVEYGTSEEVLGLVGVDGIQIISKLPAVPVNCAEVSEWMYQIVQSSLERMQIKKLHGLLLHRPLQFKGEYGEAVYQTLNELKKAGLIDNTGISIYSPAELDQLIPEFNFDIVQAPVNLFDRRLSKTGWLSRLKSRSVKVHARSAFLQGLLVMAAADRPRYFEQWKQLFDNYDHWLQEKGLGPVEACLRYVFSIPELDRVIVGVDSLKQLQQVISMLNEGPLEVPDILNSNDEKLLNPALWKMSC